MAKPGIKKRAPRSSKVAPIKADELQQIKQEPLVKPVDPMPFVWILKDKVHVYDRLDILDPFPQQRDSLRQKFANLLESFALTISRFARWVRA